MRRRGETPLATVLLHRLPLAVEVKRKGAGTSTAFGQLHALRDDEGEAGHALDALVGTADQKIYVEVVHIERNAAEAAHRVNDKLFAAALRDTANALNVVQDTGRGLAVNHRDMRHRRIVRQHLGQHRRVGALAFVKTQLDGWYLQNSRDLRYPPAVGAVREHRQFAAPRNHAADHRLHGKGAAALHQHGGIIGAFGAVTQRHLHKPAPQLLHDVVIIPVPGAPVAKHRLLHTGGGRKRPRRQKQISILFHLYRSPLQKPEAL